MTTATLTTATRTTAALRTKSNNLAVSAIVLATVLPVQAICLGALAIAEIDETHERGRGLAITAIALGSLILLGLGLVAAVSIAVSIWLPQVPWPFYT